MKKIIILTCVFLTGFFVCFFMMNNVSNKRFIERARVYAMKENILNDQLISPSVYHIVRVEFNGGLEKGGIDVDVHENTGRFMGFRKVTKR